MFYLGHFVVNIIAMNKLLLQVPFSALHTVVSLATINPVQIEGKFYIP
jgi:hypothetical protein